MGRGRKQALPGGQVQIPLLASLKNSVRWEVDEKWVGRAPFYFPKAGEGLEGQQLLAKTIGAGVEGAKKGPEGAKSEIWQNGGKA